jgi:hypothetical protein
MEYFLFQLVDGLLCGSLRRRPVLLFLMGLVLKDHQIWLKLLNERADYHFY